jgi:hypothetical protein
MPRAVTCMLRNSEISVEEALRLRDNAARGRAARLDFRCVECAQPVRPHKDGKSGAAHIEHLQRNPACKLSDPPRT